MKIVEQRTNSLLSIGEGTLRVGGRTLLHNIDIRVTRGARVGITGPSGCGKTTLLRNVVGRNWTYPSTAKYFHVTDHPIGYVPQDGGLLPWYSLEKNVIVRAPAPYDEASNAILALMELSDASGTFPFRLSGGELQRARLACALAVNPGLICADEPLTEVGLDQKWRLLNRLSSYILERDVGLLIVSHDIDTLLTLCDEVLIFGGMPAEAVHRVHLSPPHPRSTSALVGPELLAARSEIVRALTQT
jgi:ABC-type nitrate/sulfonate/bicarbonate transport system ATPase subunit